jgi:predicted O-linked N-acetylglucosamine transferase (SPINDLY family)
MTSSHEHATAAASHYAAGRYDEALAAYRIALEQAPGNAVILHNLGVALTAARRFDEAETSFRRAAAFAPAAAEPWLALGHLHFGRGRLEAAEAAFGEAALRAPRSIEAHYNAGYARHELGRWGDALAPLERARSLDPANEQVWYQLFNTRLALDQREAALADFIAFEPGAAVTPFLLRAGLESVRALGDPAREARYLRLAVEHAYGHDDIETLAGILARLQYFDIERADLLRLYRTYDRLMQQRVAAVPPLARGTRLPGKHVRVGYLSADFRQHVMGRLMGEVIAAHDRDRYSVHLYSLAPFAITGPVAGEFRLAADRFVELPQRDDREAARIIAADDCDVLVDLMAHTRFSRPEILAYKPARVIATHLGYHGAIGLSQVDFKLTDHHADLADAGDYQIEQPLPMASCVLPLRRASVGALAPPSRAMLEIDRDAVVLGEFVSIQKLSPRCLALWRAILERVPQAVLLFSPSTPNEHPAILRQLTACGIGTERARFIPRGNDDAASRARYAVVDLVLDTLPYSGGDTTSAALDAGVPVLTLAGTRHAERMSMSILRHLGLDLLVATTEADYVERAVALATNRVQRAQVVAMVAANFAAAAATYPARYTRDLEAALDAAIAARAHATD